MACCRFLVAGPSVGKFVRSNDLCDGSEQWRMIERPRRARTAYNSAQTQRSSALRPDAAPDRTVHRRRWKSSPQFSRLDSPPRSGSSLYSSIMSGTSRIPLAMPSRLKPCGTPIGPASVSGCSLLAMTSAGCRPTSTFSATTSSRDVASKLLTVCFIWQHFFSPPFNRWVIARRAPGTVFFEQSKPFKFDEIPRRSRR